MFTRFALTVLTGMSGRLLRRPRSRMSQSQTTRSKSKAKPPKTTRATCFSTAPAPVAAPTSPSQPGSVAGQAAAPASVAPPEDHFRRMRPATSAPWPAALAAASLPVLGAVGIVITLTLALGAVRGELPYMGAIESASPAWAAALVTISMWAVYLLWKVPQWQAHAWARAGNASPRELFEIENDSRGTLGQILSGVAVLTGLIFAWQQLGQTSDNLRVSQEGQITDRFSRAVDQLGSDDLTVRLGGIYALERIARDSPRDYGPVMEVLTAFVRQESPLPANAAATPVVAAPKAPPDVRAVLKVIGRRTPDQVEVEMEEGGCLDLTGINAVGVSLVGANLRNTCWNRSDLRGAQLIRADLTGATFDLADLSQQASLDGAIAPGATFSNADLAFSNLSRADLSDANLLAANLSSAQLQDTNFTDANLGGADLRNALAFGADFSDASMLGANLEGAVLSDANLATAQQLTPEQLEPALTNAGTSLPAGIEIPPDF